MKWKEILKGKGERHFYLKNGKPVQWIGETHKHPDGTLMSGKEHVEGKSKKLYHFYELSEKALRHLSKETTIIKAGQCTGPTKKTSSTAKGKKWMKCVPDGKGGYKRVHWGQRGVTVSGKRDGKRRKSFRARHNCKSCKRSDYSARCMACRDW